MHAHQHAPTSDLVYLRKDCRSVIESVFVAYLLTRKPNTMIIDSLSDIIVHIDIKNITTQRASLRYCCVYDVWCMARAIDSNNSIYHTFVLKYSSLSILKILLKIYSYSRSEIRYSSLSILILKVFSGTQNFEYIILKVGNPVLKFEYTHTQGLKPGTQV